MKLFKHSLVSVLRVSVVMMVILLTCSNQAQADTEGDFTYTITNGQAQITGYTGSGGAVTIPGTLGGAIVTSIGDNAFYGCTGLTNITIPVGVTSIGDHAFSDCTHLNSITISTGVASIGYGAFSSCTGLTSITIPGGVTSIGACAFYGCTGLTSIAIPGGVTSIGACAFGICTGLTSISVNNSNPNYSSKDGVLYNKAGDILLACPGGLTSITIPGGVTSIGDYAFYYCTGLTSITIPANFTSIGNCAFYGCTGLTSITIPANVISIGDFVFGNCTSLTSITIPANVTSIGVCAFRNCTGLTSITIPARVTSIGDYAFQGCSGLTSITFNSASTTIYDSQDTISAATTIYGYAPSTAQTYAVKYNRPFVSLGSATTAALQSIAITHPATQLSYAVGTALNLTGLVVTGTYSDNSTQIEAITAANITGFDSSAPAVDQVLTITVGGKTATYNVTIKAGVQEGDFIYIVINGKAQITGYTGAGGNIAIPNVLGGYPVTSIGEGAFTNCSSIITISIPAEVASIGKNAFRGCTGLTSFSIPAGVTIIDEGVFCGCNGLASVSIPTGVTIIGAYSFYGCSNLTAIIIPDTVTTIGDYAFYGCSRLNTINIPPTVTHIGDGIFGGCPSLPSIPIPDTTKSIPDYAYLNCTGLTSIIIPAGVTSVGQRAFYGCSALQTITFMSAATTIYDEAETIPTQAIIRGYVPSTAKDYAVKYNRTFEDIGLVTLSSIAITHPAAQLSYAVGTALNLTGLVVTGTYSDNSTQIETITAANVTGFNSTAAAANQVLTITVGGKTATYTVQITAAASMSMSKDANNLADAHDGSYSTSANIFSGGGYIIYKLSDLGLSSATGSKYTINAFDGSNQSVGLDYLDSNLSTLSSTTLNISGIKNSYKADIPSAAVYVKINGASSGSAIYIYEIEVKGAPELSRNANNLTHAYDGSYNTSANIFNGGYIIYKLSDLGLTSATGSKYTINASDGSSQSIELDYLDSSLSTLGSTTLSISGIKNSYEADISAAAVYVKINGVSAAAVYIYEIEAKGTPAPAPTADLSKDANNLTHAYDGNYNTSANIFSGGGYIIYKLSDLELSSATGSKYTINASDGSSQSIGLDYLDSNKNTLGSTTLSISGIKNSYEADIPAATVYVKINGVSATAIYIYEIEAKGTPAPTPTADLYKNANNLADAYDGNYNTSANIFSSGGYIIYKLSDLGLSSAAGSKYTINASDGSSQSVGVDYLDSNQGTIGSTTLSISGIKNSYEADIPAAAVYVKINGVSATAIYIYEIEVKDTP